MKEEEGTVIYQWGSLFHMKKHRRGNESIGIKTGIKVNITERWRKVRQLIKWGKQVHLCSALMQPKCFLRDPLFLIFLYSIQGTAAEAELPTHRGFESRKLHVKKVAKPVWKDGRNYTEEKEGLVAFLNEVRCSVFPSVDQYLTHLTLALSIIP